MQANELKPIATRPTSAINALIVDDTVTVRAYLKTILQELGVHQVFEASDGVNAEAIFLQEQPQLVFLDIQLPDINGQVLLERFRRCDQHSHIFMISAYSSVDNLKAAVAGGAKAFVVKPFTAERISNLVQPLL
ncbi:response regulator [Alishewanella longhuensis]|uniref:Response regulator n=1 Tax=Alishewanella longhuensis TaxID=1091037 RepID=A0ABQ3L2N0_9ALTE|nr:response regulator [Alishewanella longhuensis]GHG74097.1 response regulator [Alishewanella longhuensis]